MSGGYANFGSFFTPSVQSMILSESWEHPYLPESVRVIRERLRDEASFGMLSRRDFLIDFESFTFINHGAFGGSFRLVQDEIAAWQSRCETQPLRFLDRELFGHMVSLIREMADFVGCHPRDLVFVPNVTTALSTVLFSVELGSCAEDSENPTEVLMLDIGYGAVKTAAQAACLCAGATFVQAHVPLPLPAEGAEDMIEDVLLEHLSAATRLLVLDSITSNTAIMLPLQRLIKASKARRPDVLVLVDGAHALGQLPVDITALGADFFTSNCHKWLCGPRGSAILWSARRHQPHLRPLVVSHGHGHGFTSDFIWDGNRDYAPYLAVGGALAWWRTNGDAARRYMHSTLRHAVELLLEHWGTSTLAPLSMCASMACVRLPDTFQSCPPGSSTATDGKQLQEALYVRSVEVPVKVHAGHLYVRISAHVYNTPADYTALADAVAAIAQG